MTDHETTFGRITCERCSRVTDDYIGDYCSECFWATQGGMDEDQEQLYRDAYALADRVADIMPSLGEQARSFASKLHDYATGVGTFAALALALIPVTTHASTPTWEHPVFPTDAYLSGCEVRQSVDDGTRIADCPEDGAVYVWDADGQVWINDAGSPLRAPHNWYVIR